MPLRSPGASLRSNFIWTFAGNTVYAISQWGIVVILAKLSPPSTVGQFALALAVTAPVIMFANLQLGVVQATDANNEYHFADYISLRLCTAALAFLSIIAVAMLAGYDRMLVVLILVIGLSKSVESISDIIYSLIQKHERMQISAISMIIKGISSFGAMAFVMWYTNDILLATIGLASAWLLGLTLYDVPQARRFAEIRLRFAKRTMLQILKLSLPLGIVMTLLSCNANIPRYFIERVLGEDELGYFAAVAYFMLAGNTIVGALGQSATPRIAKHYAAGNIPAVKTLLLKLLAVGVVLGFGGWIVSVFFGATILSLLYTPEYATQASLFSLLMAIAGINYVASFLGYGITAMRYFRSQIPLFLVVLLVTLAGCVLLMPRAGLTGAAQAMGAAALVQLIGSAIISRHALRSRDGEEKPIIT